MTFEAPLRNSHPLHLGEGGGGGGGGAHKNITTNPKKLNIKGKKIQFQLSEFELTTQVKVTDKWGEIQGNWT